MTRFSMIAATAAAFVATSCTNSVACAALYVEWARSEARLQVVESDVSAAREQFMELLRQVVNSGDLTFESGTLERIQDVSEDEALDVYEGFFHALMKYHFESEHLVVSASRLIECLVSE